jgi:hypothetical protein
MPVAVKKKKAVRKSRRPLVAKSYDVFKSYDGKQYTGMKVGGSHKWYYDKGVWKDKKITPDIWEINFAVTKRRAGKAPRGSGAAVGTGYHWYIMAHQTVMKLNADDYSTVMSGLKFKLAHKRAAGKSWSNSAAKRRTELIDYFEGMIRQLKQKPIEIEFDYKDQTYKGEAMPVLASLFEGKYYDYEIMLNGMHFGILHRLKNNWKVEGVEDNKLVKVLGEQVDPEHG